MNLSNLRRWSLVAVVANVGVAVLAAIVMPAHVLGLLPVLALTLPLLTTGVLEAAASGSARHT